ncbi:hypothetical protein Tco_0563542 [Tanacetum coccineum]
MAGVHAYHEGEEILKEDRKESKFQWAPRNQGNRNGDDPRRIVPVETHANALVVQDGIGGYNWSFQAEEGPTDFALMAHLSSGSSSSSSSDSERDAHKKSNLEIIGYQLGLESLEARIIVHQRNEAVYEEDIAFLKYDVKLTKLINSQISVNNKSGVGFDSQMNENELHDCHLNKSKVFESASYSIVNEIEEECSILDIITQGRFIIRTSLTGIPAQSVRSSNADALDSLHLLVSLYRTPQSRLPH